VMIIPKLTLVIYYKETNIGDLLIAQINIGDDYNETNIGDLLITQINILNCLSWCQYH
jgi:hypothetical protein